jgi:hypothetical protein
LRTPFSLKQRNYYPWLFLGLGVAANAIAVLAFPSQFTPSVLITVTGAVAALVHFLYAQHNHNTERFITLFREFNSRYDKLNDRLNALLAKSQALLLTGEENRLLYDYFNLCAEEYLYFKSGYIDSEVWTAWLRGMRIFATHKEIRRLWEEELSSGSYYGFTLSRIDGAP